MLLGPATSGLWRALAQNQNHLLGGGPAELTELLEQYSKNIAQNMKLTYLNPVALVSPNIGENRLIALAGGRTASLKPMKMNESLVKC